jgi:Uma2 family endonuclease
MDLLLENVEESMPVILHPPRMSDDEYYNFCRQYNGFRVERMSDGSIIMMPPAGWESGYRNNDLSMQLGLWAKRDGRGKAFDSNTEYLLPDGSALSPDASWVSQEKIEQVPANQRKKFPRICPDFVVELISPSDRLNSAKTKMQAWIKNGVQLGWLIHPDQKQVFIYRQNAEPEILHAPDQVVGERPVAGFVLDLKDIWAGL